MKANQPNQNFRSMGIPPEFKKAVERHEEQKRALDDTKEQETTEMSYESQDVNHEEKSDIDLRAEKKVKLEKIKKEIEERYQFSITQDDLEEYIFKGSLTKELIITPPNALRVVFRTHTASDTEAIQVCVGKYMDMKPAPTSRAVANEETLRTLGYVMIGINGKNIGADAEKRYDNIKKMGGVFLTKIGEAWQNFNLLLEIVLGEEDVLKKL